MNNDVIVVVPDKLIIVDGRGIRFDFIVPDDMPIGLHALQWHDGKGEIEIITDNIQSNHIIIPTDYEHIVQPFVDLWEVQRIIEDAPPPPPTLEAKQATIRQKRDKLLIDCDYTQMPDSPLSEAEKEEWKIYRQALRDITEDALFLTVPEQIIFPVKL